jgi:hypothetical protein
MREEMNKQLIAFHGDDKIKDKYMKRLEAHKAADEIIKGTYWQNGKGCAVGCTVHSDNHAAYETELGIPRILARLEDGIFENLQNGRAKDWPIQFLSAIPIGADLSNVWPQFAIWMLIDEKWGVLQFAKKEKTKESIIAIAKFYQEGKFSKKEHYDEIRKLRADDAAYAAAYAADAAAYAADVAADVAAADAAAYAADDAADAAADDAAYAAADAAADAADDAAYAAADADDAADVAAYAAAYAAYAARNKWREAQADKLLELLGTAPVLVTA